MILISLIWIPSYPLVGVTIDIVMAILVVVLTIVLFATSRPPRTG